MRNKPATIAIAAVFALAAIFSVVEAQQKKPIQRAKHPQFNKAVYGGIFFDDVASEALVGSRPANIGVAPAANVAAGRAVGGNPGDAPAASGGGDGGVFPWSKLISRETLEDQVKQIKIRVDQNISTPSDFRGRGYQVARRDFTVLAMLFGIIGEYDGDVRWKELGPGFRELFARSAGNAKVGSVQAYNEAKIRKQDLQDLVGGGSPVVPAAEPAAKWGSIVDRGPLMQMLESTHQGKLQPMLASKAEFDANQADLKRYAEMIAATAELLTKEGMPDGDDTDYAGFSTRMKEGALKIIDGINLNNFDNARSGAGEISKACSECHELYRG